MGINGCGCLFFIGSSIVIALFIPLMMWLSVISADESLIKCSMQDFFIPSMAINGARYSLNTSSTIFFDLQLTEEANDMGVYYDNLTLTFSYVGTPDSIIPVANYTLPGFHQKGGEHGATTYRSDYVTTRAVEVSKNESSYLSVVIRVDLACAVRFKYSSWTSKRHKVVVRGDVEVNGVTGRKESQKGIKLKPYVGHHHSQAVYRAVFGLCISIYMLLSLVWCLSMCCICKYS